MARINMISPEKGSQEVKALYEKLQKKTGKIPNVFLYMGNSAALLKGFLDLSEAANESSLSPLLREQIALAVSESNHCHYCLSAHTAIAKGLGLSSEDIIQARLGLTEEAKSLAILKFAKAIVEKKGQVAHHDVATLKAAGVSDTELVDVLLVVMVTIFTNYFNHITDPVIDFPVAPEIV